MEWIQNIIASILILLSSTGVMFGAPTTGANYIANTLKLPNILGAGCIGTDGSGMVQIGTCTGGSGSNAFQIATTSGITVPGLAYFTKASGMTTLGSVSTTTLTTSGALSFSQPVTILGSASSALTLDTSGSWTGNAGTATALAANGANCSSGSAPLGVDASGAVESCFDVWTEAENTSAGYVQSTRTLTVAGTANQVSSSAGAQDLSANRTWTLSLPNHVIFPNSFFASLASTTNATTTNLHITSLLTGALAVDGNGKVYRTSTTTAGTGLSFDGTSFNNTGVLSNVAGSGINVSGATGNVTISTNDRDDIATSTDIAISQMLYVTKTGGLTTFASTPTTTASCSGTVSCSAFTIVGGTPVTITGAGVTSNPFEIATTTDIAISGLAFFNRTTGRTTLASVSTTTVTATLPLSLSQPVVKVGGTNSVLSISTTTNSLFTGIAGQILGYTNLGWIGIATTTAGTGLTYTGSAFNVNTSQNIATLSNLTGNGLVFTSGGTGTLNTANFSANTMPYVNGAGTGIAYTATSSLSSGSGLTLTGTLGALVGGSNSSLAVNDRDDIATTTDIAISQLAYYSKASGLTTLAGVSTTTLAAGTNISFSGGTPVILGSSPITINATGGGSGNMSGWATTTTAGQLLLHPVNATTTDVLFGTNATTTAPFWWDISATTTYIGTGGAGSSTSQYGRPGFEWLMGYDGSDNAFKISSSTVDVGFTTNNFFTITKSGNIGIGTSTPYAALSVVGSSGIVADKIFATSTTASSTFAWGVGVNSLAVTNLVSCDSIDTDSNGQLKCGTDSGGAGGAVTEKFATSTADNLAIHPNVALSLGLGVTSPRFALEIGSSTRPQLALSDLGVSTNDWTFRNINENFYMATSSGTTYATSTNPVFAIEKILDRILITIGNIYSSIVNIIGVGVNYSFSVATSTDSGAFPGLFIKATSTPPDGIGIQASIGTSTQDLMLAAMNGRLLVNGPISTGEWQRNICNTAAQQTTQIAADTRAFCGDFYFAEGGAGVADFVATGGDSYFRLRVGATGTTNVTSDDGAVTMATASLNTATNTPKMLVKFRQEDTNLSTTTTNYYIPRIGFQSTTGLAADYAAATQVGCFFTATTTTANWIAVCRNTNETNRNTGIASTTFSGSGAGAGGWYVGYIEINNNVADFYLWRIGNGQKSHVRISGADVPNTTLLNPTISVGRIGTNATQPSLSFTRLEYWWKDRNSY